MRTIAILVACFVHLLRAAEPETKALSTSLVEYRFWAGLTTDPIHSFRMRISSSGETTVEYFLGNDKWELVCKSQCNDNDLAGLKTLVALPAMLNSLKSIQKDIDESRMEMIRSGERKIFSADHDGQWESLAVYTDGVALGWSSYQIIRQVKFYPKLDSLRNINTLAELLSRLADSALGVANPFKSVRERRNFDVDEWLNSLLSKQEVTH